MTVLKHMAAIRSEADRGGPTGADMLVNDGMEDCTVWKQVLMAVKDQQCPLYQSGTRSA